MSIFDKIRRFFGQSSANGEGDAPDDGHTVEMIPCEEALRLVHEYLDGELDGVPERQVRRHFEVCGRCYPHLRLESSYRDAVRRAVAGEAAPAELKRKVTRLLAEVDGEE